MMPSANEHQVGGSHYRNENGYQHWDLVADLRMNYFTAVLTKYVCRWRQKDGVRDLEKAIHYCQKLQELHAQGRMPWGEREQVPARYDARSLVLRLNLPQAEFNIVALAALYHTPNDLAQLHTLLVDLLTEAMETRSSV